MAVTDLYGTAEPTGGPAAGEGCTLQIGIIYEAVPFVACAACLLFGLHLCFFGYRCLKRVLFSSGIMFALAVVPLLYQTGPVLDSPLDMDTMVGMALGVSILLGLLAALYPSVGYALCGLQLGSLVCLGVLVLVGQFWTVAPQWVPVVSVLATGAPTAVLTLQWPRAFMILYTSALGAATVTLCADYALGTFALPDEVYSVFQYGSGRPLCWFDWAVFGIWPLLCAVGVLVQWKWTAKKPSQKEGFSKKQKKRVLKHRHFVQGGRRPHRRRRPPPLKRYAGDVLAPSYIQTLQERRMGTGSSCSSISTITHTLIDFDFETGSMVPLTASPTPPPTFAV